MSGAPVRVAIASGKGGTGKTTVATNLAHVAGCEGRDVSYLDCDVEEPNGHIFLKPDITQRKRVGSPNRFVFEWQFQSAVANGG